jgi:hypothetical protein
MQQQQQQQQQECVLPHLQRQSSAAGSRPVLQVVGGVAVRTNGCGCVPLRHSEEEGMCRAEDTKTVGVVCSRFVNQVQHAAAAAAAQHKAAAAAAARMRFASFTAPVKCCWQPPSAAGGWGRCGPYQRLWLRAYAE